MTTTALRAGWLFDGVAAALVPNPTSLDGGTIVAVKLGGPPRPTAPPSSTSAVRQWLPGLIDTHVHLAFDASEDPVGNLARRDDTAALAAMTAAARACRPAAE